MGEQDGLQNKHLGTIAASLEEMASQSSLRVMQRNKELAVMSANGTLQFFLEDNDRAKAAEMAMIMYNGARAAASTAMPSREEVDNTSSDEE